MNRRAKFIKKTSGVSSGLLAMVPFIVASAFLPTVASATGLRSDPAQKTSGMSSPSRAQTASAPHCQTSGTSELKVVCDFTPLSVNANPPADEPRIALNHAALSFKTKHDGWTSVALTFTKLDPASISEPRSVYLAVDDDSGHNFIRRVLRRVDLRTLVTGKATEFSENLLLPALQPGHYRVELWIPSSDPSLKFNAEHNFLISSHGVANKKTGLNQIATLSVAR